MKRKEFKTDKLILSSYSLLVFSYGWFFFLLLKKYGGVSLNLLILFFLILPVLGYFLFLFRKRVLIDERGIEVRGLFGKKFFNWGDVKEVSLSVGRKAFLFLTSREGEVMIIDDSVSNFKELVSLVLEKVPKNTFSKEVVSQLNLYKRSYASTVLILVASLLLIFLFLWR